MAKQILTVTVDNGMPLILKNLAARDDRTLSAMVNHLLKAELEKRGLLECA